MLVILSITSIAQVQMDVLFNDFLLHLLLAKLSQETNRRLTPARTCQDRRKLFVPAVAGREMLGVPYINRP